jgi:hypothetical protein
MREKLIGGGRKVKGVRAVEPGGKKVRALKTCPTIRRELTSTHCGYLSNLVEK